MFCGSSSVSVPYDRIGFPDTFTAYQLLQAGSGSCLRCYSMLHDPRYRRYSWLIKDDVYAVLTRPLDTLLNPPDPPFLIYLTRTRRKHGWILAVQYPVLDKKRFFVAVDETRILVDVDRLSQLYKFYTELRGMKLSKRNLRGELGSRLIRRIGFDSYKRLLMLRGDPLWNLIVDFGR